MTEKRKRWQPQPKVPPELVEKFPEIDRILLQLLFSRGITDKATIDRFLEPDYARDVHDPFAFRDMRKAVLRIEEALRKDERIVVYGDYDADGVCASAVMTETLKALGGIFDVYIPFRETEGYGMNVAAVEKIADEGAKLVITVDCGTTNIAEVARARELGIDVIITDHHDEPPMLPKPFAFINPVLRAEIYPFRRLAAAGVAFKLATALLRHTAYGKSLNRIPLPIGWEKWLLDLVAVSTVSDMVPILGENRILVRYGLDVLQKARRVGLRELFKTMRTPLERADEETLAFQVGPRLNAAGRMGHASTAYELLVTEDVAEAAKLSQGLSSANSERQRLTEKTVQDALAQIGEHPTKLFLSAIGDTWMVGILGLVASRIVDRYHRPTMIFSRSNGRVVASGRSPEGFDITAALVRVKEHLDRFGGHPQACGLTVKPGADLGALLASLEAIAEKSLKGSDLRPVLPIDAEIVLEDISWKLVEDVERLAPFGVDAERPKFLSRGLRIIAVDTVGKDGKHLKLHVNHATSAIHKTIGFSLGDWSEVLRPGDTVDVVFEVGVNEWNGNREIELKIVDLDHAQP